MTCLLIFKKLMTVLKNINANNFLNIKILKIKIIFLKSLEKDILMVLKPQEINKI